MISSVEKLPTTQHGCPLRVRTKHFFCAEFIIPKERDCTELYNRLSRIKPGRLSPIFSFDFVFFNRLDSSDQLYCFLYQAPKYLEKIWDPFLLETEFMRMGVPNREWRLEEINQNFEICETYPPILYVPSSTTKSMLFASAKFRSRGRLPRFNLSSSEWSRSIRCFFAPN